MHLLLLLLTLLLTLSGCGEDEEVAFVPTQEDNSLMETFTLINMENTTHKVTLSPKKLTFHDIEQSVVIIHIFNTLSLDNAYQLKALTSLQEKYPKNLFVVSLLIGDAINTQTLQSFITNSHLTHYLSNDIENQSFKNILFESLTLDTSAVLPMSVIYNDDGYLTHYSGAIPIEMISYDIAQVLEISK